MRVILLLVLFVIIMVLQVISLREGFGGQPGVQVQMNANNSAIYVARVPDYSAQQVEEDEWRLFW